MGGVLVLVGTVVLTGDIWSDLPLGGRIALAAGVTVLLGDDALRLPGDGTGW